MTVANVTTGGLGDSPLSNGGGEKHPQLPQLICIILTPHSWALGSPARSNLNCWHSKIHRFSTRCDQKQYRYHWIYGSCIIVHTMIQLTLLQESHILQLCNLPTEGCFSNHLLAANHVLLTKTPSQLKLSRALGSITRFRLWLKNHCQMSGKNNSQMSRSEDCLARSLVPGSG